MLQKDASNADASNANAYSWWLVRHIRTKQSKWLHQSLEDMEEKVKYVLKLLEEDGDSFARRAEMYYKKRPELISFVEESYRAFRALAERYDHLSKDMQNANNTLATVCPQQFQLPMDEELPTNFPLEANESHPKSCLSKDEALEEIDMLQKEIVALQTIEIQIIEKQQKLCRLQDEFSLNKVIDIQDDDEEASALMAEAALKSCQETLAQLQEEQEKQNQESRGEYKKIEEARLKLESIRRQFLNDDTKEESAIDKGEGECSSESFAVTQLAEKIDELVNKVINLETSVSSQTLLIDRLRTKACDLHSQTNVLEEDKANLIDHSQNLRIKVEKLEENLYGIQDLNRDVECRNSYLQTDFAEARSSLDHLSEKLSNVKPDEEISEIPPQVVEEKVVQPFTDTARNEAVEEIKEEDPGTPAKSKRTVKFRDPIAKEMLDDDKKTETQGDFDWQKMLLNEMDDKEKALLKEYETVLKNYKEVKNKLVDKENKEKDQEFEITLQIRQLKSAVSKRDEEIQFLRQRLNGASDISEVKTEDFHGPSIDSEDEEIKMVFVDKDKAISPIEEKLRHDIDTIVAENLDFWLKFTTSYQQIGKFTSSVQELQDQIAKMLKTKKKKEGSGDLKCDVRAIYKQLKEIQAELTVWREQSAQLRKEVEKRFSSLCSIQEKITNALKEEEITISSHHAARFQGEILNMKQENNKIREELQTGVDHVTILQFEIDTTLRKLNEDFELLGDTQKPSRPHVPLRAFIFGTKQKKHRHSIFSYMHHSRKFQAFRSGMQ